MSASPLSPSCLGSSRTNRNVIFVMKSKKITFGKNCIYIICCIQIHVLGKQEIAYKYAKLVISWPPPSTWFPSTWWWQPEKGRCLWCKISWAYKRKIVLKCPNNQFQSLAFMKLKVGKKKFFLNTSHILNYGQLCLAHVLRHLSPEQCIWAQGFPQGCHRVLSLG